MLVVPLLRGRKTAADSSYAEILHLYFLSSVMHNHIYTKWSESSVEFLASWKNVCDKLCLLIGSWTRNTMPVFLALSSHGNVGEITFPASWVKSPLKKFLFECFPTCSTSRTHTHAHTLPSHGKKLKKNKKPKNIHNFPIPRTYRLCVICRNRKGC